MTVHAVLLPVFVYVVLVYGLLGALIVSRQLERRPKVAGGLDWAGAARRIGASYTNQFEMPVLFFGLVGLGLAAGRTDEWFVTLEWLFVLTRFVHAAIHVTVNILALRGLAFAAGAAILGVAWIRFALDILGG